MTRPLAVLVFVAASLLSSGCSLLHAVRPTLDVITAAVTNIDQIVDAIDDAAPAVLAAEQATDSQVQAYLRASHVFHITLAGVIATCNTGTELDDGQVAAALASIAQAWQDYVAAARVAGIDVQALKPGAPGRFGVMRNVVTVPEPIALRGRS